MGLFHFDFGQLLFLLHFLSLGVWKFKVSRSENVYLSVD